MVNTILFTLAILTATYIVDISFKKIGKNKGKN